MKNKGFINGIALLIILIAAAVGGFFYWQEKTGHKWGCAEITVKAKNPLTGEVKEFGTNCDVPEGWEEVPQNP